MKPMLFRAGPPAALALFTLLACARLNADQVLFSPQPDLDLSQVALSDAKAFPTNAGATTVLQVATGTNQNWPGITIRAAEPWDLAAWAEVAAELKNSGAVPVTVYCRVDNPGADGTRNCVTASSELAPGETGTIKVPLQRTNDGKRDAKLFGMRGYPASAGGPGAINPKNITQLLLFVSKPSVPHEFQVRKVVATGRYVPPTAWLEDADPFFPFLDTFGQYRHKPWPGKVTSVADLENRRKSEADELGRQPGPPDWDKYGGWAGGPKREASGFFRVEKVDGKWWLIDPEGHLFFSHGVDCVRMLDTTPIEERETWFENFPGAQPAFAEFLSQPYALKGHYAGRSPKCFSFAGANLARKYGPEWKKICPEVIQRRLRSWGLNTIANWSDESIRLLRRTPYTDTIGSGGTRMVESSEGYWGKFPDVFDPSFTESLRRQMEAKAGRSAGDPWCIGYFSDNEMSWGNERSLTIAALKSPADQKLKQVVVEELKKKYTEIGKLNDHWGTPHASWAALLESREAPDPDKAREDLEACYTTIAERYFRTVRDTIKAVTPKQLYLGCRFAWVNARAAAAAAKYCDVVSYNLYQRSVAEFRTKDGADVPLIIGEFHFGALDRGMFHTGLVRVADQAARAQAYRDYVRGALKHPQFVGTHWFQYQDEPTTGRVWDEENYQIGLVDIADTPYAETLQAVRDVGYHLYR